MELTEILEQVLQKEPERYSTATVQRVSGLIDAIDSGMGHKIPYSMLTTIDDFILYKSLHPEWDSWTPSNTAKKDPLNCYIALGRWAKKKYPDDKKRRVKEMNKVFQTSNRWAKLYTLEDWKKEYSNHPEWQGMTNGDMINDPEAKKFYQSFRKWANSTADTKEEAKKMIAQVITRKHRDWTGYKTKVQWEAEYAKHPKWHGLTSDEINTTNIAGSRGFYHAFLRWLAKDMPDPDQRKDYVAELFAKYHK